MAKKRRVRYDRILLCVLVSILLIAIIVMGIRFILKDDSSDKNTTNNNTTEIVSSDDIKIELEDYSVYKDTNSDLGFNFVVATLKFTSKDSVSYDLANLKTNEGISLNSVLEYTKQLTMASYNIDSLNVTNTVSSTEKEYSAKVFIPYKEGNSITLIDSISKASILIDVSKNEKDINTLKKEDNSKDIVSSDYNISVANSYIASNMRHNGEYYDSSMLNVYVFEMKVNSISNNVKVTSATFKQSSTGETWDAMDESYSSSKSGSIINNILNTDLTVDGNYALFFDVYSNGEETPDYKGTITISFSDGTSTTIDTELN